MFFFGWILQFLTSVIKHFIRLCFAQLLNKFGRFCKELTAEKNRIHLIQLDKYENSSGFRVALDNVLKFVCYLLLAIEIRFGKIRISLPHCSLSPPQLSLFLYKTLAVYFALKSMSADAILSSKYKKNRPENAFREVVSTREVYGGKWRFGSFAGRFPGPRSFRVFWETHARTGGGHPQCRGGSRGRV